MAFYKEMPLQVLIFTFLYIEDALDITFSEAKCRPMAY